MKLRELGELGVRYIRRFCNYLKIPSVGEHRAVLLKRSRTALLSALVADSLPSLPMKFHRVEALTVRASPSSVRSVTIAARVVCLHTKPEKVTVFSLSMGAAWPPRPCKDDGAFVIGRFGD